MVTASSIFLQWHVNKILDSYPLPPQLSFILEYRQNYFAVGMIFKQNTCPTQSFSCPKKLIKITKTRE
jgi:hypothetical protein